MRHQDEARMRAIDPDFDIRAYKNGLDSIAQWLAEDRKRDVLYERHQEGLYTPEEVIDGSGRSYTVWLPAIFP